VCVCVCVCVHERIRFGSRLGRRRAPVFIIIKEPSAVTLASSDAHKHTHLLTHTQTRYIMCLLYIFYMYRTVVYSFTRSLTSWLVRDGCSRHVKHANGFDIIIIIIIVVCVMDGRWLGVDNAFRSRVRTVYTASPGSILYRFLSYTCYNIIYYYNKCVYAFCIIYYYYYYYFTGLPTATVSVFSFCCTTILFVYCTQ